MPIASLESIHPGDYVEVTTYGQINGKSTFKGKLVGRGTADYLQSTTTAPVDHVNIYRELPAEVKNTIENKWDSYPYITIMTDSGLVNLGEPWIIPTTVYRVVSGTVVIELDKFNDADLGRVRSLLEINGYQIKTIRFAS